MGDVPAGRHLRLEEVPHQPVLGDAEGDVAGVPWRAKCSTRYSGIGGASTRARPRAERRSGRSVMAGFYGPRPEPRRVRAGVHTLRSRGSAHGGIRRRARHVSPDPGRRRPRHGRSPHRRRRPVGGRDRGALAGAGRPGRRLHVPDDQQLQPGPGARAGGAGLRGPGGPGPVPGRRLAPPRPGDRVGRLRASGGRDRPPRLRPRPEGGHAVLLQRAGRGRPGAEHRRAWPTRSCATAITTPTSPGWPRSACAGT